MACPGPPSALFYLEVVLIKRFVTLLLAFALAVGFAVDFAPRGKAVAPQLGLAAVGLAAFVVSSGFSMLWEDKEHNTDMLISDLQDLWAEYQASTTGVPGLDGFPEGSVTLGGQNAAQIILNRDAAQTYQGFVNWMAGKYDWKPNEPQTIINPSSSEGTVLSGSTSLSYPFVFSPAIKDCGWLNTSRNVYFHTNVPVSVSLWYINDYSAFLVAASSSPFLYSATIGENLNPPTSSPGTFTYNGKTVYVKYQIEDSISNTITGNGLTINYYSGGFPGVGDRSKIGWEMVYGNVSISSGGGLLATVADAILNRVSHMLPTDTMALDVGYVAAEQEDEQDIIAGIADAIIAGFEGVAPLDVNATIVGAEGTEVLYPTEYVTDVDSLGLPDLGAALVRRFPFSIPWDFVECFKTLSAPAKDPVFTVDLFPAAFKSKVGITADTSFTIDGTDPKFSTLVLIVRWSALVTFYLALAFGTKRLIWTTGG